MMGGDDGAYKVLHPNMWMFEVEYTGAYKFEPFANSTVTSVIVDDVDSPSAISGGTINLTKGKHILYVTASIPSWSGTSCNTYGYGVVNIIRTPIISATGISRIYHAGPTIIYATAENPIPLSWNDSLTYNSISKIYVPEGRSDTYKSTGNWTKFADKIEEIKYKIIED